MKKIGYLYLFAIGIFVTTIVSCVKSEETIPVGKTEMAKPKVGDITVTSTTSIVWHRPISIRPRDGEPCMCEMCFGICARTDVVFNYSSISSPPPSPPNFGDSILTSVTEIKEGLLRVYLLENISWAEETIHIDEPINFRMRGFPGFPDKDIKLLTGIYKFTQQTGRLDCFRNEITYYGYFDGETGR